MLTILDKQIEEVELRLLPSGARFDQQRRNVIKSLESVNVLACPGSGKTTALLAKLLIISDQLPLDDNRGICVLTHTNVAIDTITNKLGINTAKLFRYPNCFGTIQSFVDKYLAVPAYIEQYNRRPDIISNEWYHAKVETQFKFLTNSAKSYCYRYEQKGYPFTIEFNDFILDGDSSPTLKLNLSIAKEKEIYGSLVKMKKRVLGYGILSYDDAYFLATRYIRRHSSISDLFSARYAYVFIDEMQDTDRKQGDLLASIFKTPAIVQKIGDLNQSIFSHSGVKDEGTWAVTSDAIKLEITGSKRFSKNIAKVIAPIAVNPQQLTGNDKVPEIMPTIISFDDSNIMKVLPRFGDCIIGLQLHRDSPQVFKAIGWIGKKHDSKHTIPSYWDSFQKELQTKSDDFPSLADYLRPVDNDKINLLTVNHYKKGIVRAVLKSLRIGESANTIKPNSERNLVRHLKDLEKYEEFRHSLAVWCLRIHARQEILSDIIDYIQSVLFPIYKTKSNNDLETFFHGAQSKMDKESVDADPNIYNHSLEDQNIDIEVCTIHRAKGETHTATLYLETYYRQYDLDRIMDYLKGNHQAPSKSMVIQNLKMAYVGMSRPSHLLCLAMHSAHLDGHADELTAQGWTIDDTLAR